MNHRASNISRLIEVASEPLGCDLCNQDSPGSLAEAISSELGELLRSRNGFYAFEGALLVRPSCTKGLIIGIREWNAQELWRGGYEGSEGDVTFFAEDAFGFQFAIGETGVSLFDPETASHQHLAGSIEDWCGLLMSDYPSQTGAGVLHEWQLRFGAIAPGMRLNPTQPFVLGGGYTINNLRAVEDVESMRFRAHLYCEIRNLPDGAAVKLQVL